MLSDEPEFGIMNPRTANAFVQIMKRMMEEYIEGIIKKLRPGGRLALPLPAMQFPKMAQRRGTIMIDFLKSEHIDDGIIRDIMKFREFYPAEEKDWDRIPVPKYHYFGKEVWEQAATAILCGQNLLLAGGKATGKNILAENLAAAFGRPVWNISFHINMDAATLIGTDTFTDGSVVFRPGPVCRCAKNGGFGVLDEINMAKNEALAVLHAALDYRRVIDVPGYERIPLREDTRFIATMNYGYAGTRELNEALASRFAVISMPPATGEQLRRILNSGYPKLRTQYAEQFALLYLDIEKKCENAEISTKALDLRGLLDALDLMSRGLDAGAALDMGITNKSFDRYEQDLIRDLIKGRIPKKLGREELFIN